MADLAEWVRSQMRQGEDVAAFLVGSAASGKGTVDSDIDIAVIGPLHSRAQTWETCFAGRPVELVYYSAEDFERWPLVPLLDHPALRIAGRLTTGRLLWEDWPFLEDAKQRWKNAILAPDCAGRLFETASQNLQYASSAVVTEDEADRLWALLGALGALATLKLDMTDGRFQKPKWVLQSLSSSNSFDLTEAIGLSLSADEHLDRKTAERAFNAVTAALEAAEKTHPETLTGSSPPEGRTPQRFIRYILQGSKGLCIAGDYLGAMYTSIAALRVLFSVVSGPIETSCPVQHTTERSAALRRALPAACFATETIDRAADLTLSAALEIQRDYKSCFEKRGKCSKVAHLHT